MDEYEEKLQMRHVYPFTNDVGFEAFYSGMKAAYSGQTKKSIELFRESAQADPSNPIPYNFLAMSLEFDSDISEEDRLKIVEKWVEVADESGNKTQMMRAHMTLKWYKMSPEERRKNEEELKHGRTG